MGSRMLPASLFMPKETMPLVDTPLINHLVWEAAKAGVTRIHIVLSRRKELLIRDFLSGGMAYFEEIRQDLPRDALSLGVEGIQIIPHIQEEPGGVGDAISTAMGQIEGDFLVLLGDNILLKEHFGPAKSGPEFASGASLELVEKFEETGFPCVGVSSVSPDELGKYGVVGFDGSRISTIIEKPDPLEAPSNYVLSGRYLLPGNTSEIIDRYPMNEHGEMQSIAILRHLIDEPGIESVKLDDYALYDSGNPMSWLKSQIDHALKREDIGVEITNWLQERMEK